MITQLSLSATPGKRYGSFTGKGIAEVEVPGAAINVELLRRKREKERLEFILAEDEELFMMVAAAMVEVKKRWVN